MLIGCVVSLIAGLFATVGLWHLAARLTDDATADRTVVLFAFMPAAFVMSMVYADALFVCLAVVCLLALLDGRWVAAGVAAAGAGFVRPTATRARRRVPVGRGRGDPGREVVAGARGARDRPRGNVALPRVQLVAHRARRSRSSRCSHEGGGTASTWGGEHPRRLSHVARGA